MHKFTIGAESINFAKNKTIKNSEPIDFEFNIHVVSCSLNVGNLNGQNVKLRFVGQCNIKEVVLAADEVENSDPNTCEISFHGRAALNTIMSFKEFQPIEKIVKLSLEEHTGRESRVLATAKIDLAECILKAVKDECKSIYEDITFLQGLGCMRLRISPRKMELREKVNMALTKPPMPMKINRMPASPRRYQKSDVETISNECKPPYSLTPHRPILTRKLQRYQLQS
jgi:hypothetical protein